MFMKFVARREQEIMDKSGVNTSLGDLEGEARKPSRYTMFFTDALKVTDENSTAAVVLAEALTKAETMATQIEDKVASVENNQLLLQLGKKFGISSIFKASSLYQRGIAVNEILVDGTVLATSLLLFKNELVVLSHTNHGTTASHWGFNGMIVVDMGSERFSIKIHDQDMNPKKTMLFECPKDPDSKERLVFVELLQQRLLEEELRGLEDSMMPKSSIFMNTAHSRQHYFRLLNYQKLSALPMQGECSLVVFEAKDDISEITALLKKLYT